MFVAPARLLETFYIFFLARYNRAKPIFSFVAGSKISLFYRSMALRNFRNTFFGVLIIAVLQPGLAQLGTSDPVKRIITGAVIVAAVLLDSWRNPKKH